MASLEEALRPKSDQLNADDLIPGPITVTISRVEVFEKKAADTQPIVIHIDGGRQPFKPCKSMGRLIAHCWGVDYENWAGRSMTLYRDPDVMFGGEKVGGIRISHMSHIERRAEIALTKARGKKAIFTVEPLSITQGQLKTLLNRIKAIKPESDDRRKYVAELGVTGDPTLPESWTRAAYATAKAFCDNSEGGQ